jgi:hypothetical protein
MESDAADLIRQLQAMKAQADEFSSFVKLGNEAAAPFERDGEWKGQGWIANARLWIALMNAGLALKHQPELLVAVKSDARKVFHTLNQLRDKAQREAPHDYSRFIDEANVIADEARELIN